MASTDEWSPEDRGEGLAVIEGGEEILGEGDAGGADLGGIVKAEGSGGGHLGAAAGGDSEEVFEKLESVVGHGARQVLGAKLPECAGEGGGWDGAQHAEDVEGVFVLEARRTLQAVPDL